MVGEEGGARQLLTAGGVRRSLGSEHAAQHGQGLDVTHLAVVVQPRESESKRERHEE